MPFKSDKQRKWMHANEPDMAKKWEKEEAIKGKLQNLIKQELKINKLEAFRPKGISQWKSFVLLPKSKMYFDPTTQYFWLMGPGGEPDWEDDPIEPKDWDYKRTLSRLSSKDKSIIKKSLRGKGNWKEATTSVSVPGYLSPQAFSKSTQKAIDTDDEDDEKNESTKEYGKTLDKIAKDRHLKSISKKDRSILMKIAKLMKRANESINEGWWEDLSDKAQKSYIKKHGSAPNSSGKKDDIGSHITKAISKDKKGQDKRKKLNRDWDAKTSTASDIAKDMGGNMTGAVKKIEKIKKGLSDDPKVKAALRKANESLNESDLGLTYKKGKTVKVTHKKSGKELVIIDKPNVKREYEKIGFYAEGKVNELSMKPFSSQEAKQHINSDIKDMSKLLGKTSQKVIKIMMDGVKGGKYTAMDISRGVQEGPAGRTHFGELDFIQQLWSKMREKFRRYSKDRKLS